MYLNKIISNTYKKVILVILLSVFQTVNAIEFWVAPKKGQSVEQQKKDEFKCYSLAKKQTNYDPRAETKPKGGVIRYALIGAAIGGGIGASGYIKKPAEGAVLGGVTGGVLGGIRKREHKKETQDMVEKKQLGDTEFAQLQNDYSQAYTDCLTARGYIAYEH